MKVPIGFRFRPTDEELVVHYLKRKSFSLTLPANVIPQLHLHAFKFHPLSLPGDSKEKRYYFCKRKGELRNKLSNAMPTCSGFWRVTGKGKKILSSGDKNDVVGTRKTWRFYQTNAQSRHGHGSETRWVMHEFQLVDSTKKETNEGGDWVVCRVFQRKTKSKKHGMIIQKCICCNTKKIDCKMGNDSPSSFDFKVDSNFELGPPQPSSPFSTIDS